MSYIERETIRDAILNDSDYDNDTINHFLDVVDDATDADVAPVVHGRWKKVRFSKGIMACSACDFYFQETQMPHRKYCPNCGAEMGGEKHEAE